MHIVLANLVLILDSKIRTVLSWNQIYNNKWLNSNRTKLFLREVELNHRTFKKYGFSKNTIKLLKIGCV